MRPDPGSHRSAQRGFSLLEAIVALTILATVGMALFAAMSQSTQMIARAENARRVDSAVRNAAAWLASVNPAETPQGEQQLGDVTLRWSSDLVERMHEAMTGYLQRSEEHTSELQSRMSSSYAVFCLQTNSNYYHRPT